MRQAGRRVQHEHHAQGDRQGRGVHEGVAPADPRAGVVGYLAHHEVPEGVDHHGGAQRPADPVGRQAFQLVVVEEQGPQDLDLGAVGDGADAVGQLGSKADVLGRGRGEAHDAALPGRNDAISGG